MRKMGPEGIFGGFQSYSVDLSYGILKQRCLFADIPKIVHRTTSVIERKGGEYSERG
jgi:hypothetical protein